MIDLSGVGRSLTVCCNAHGFVQLKQTLTVIENVLFKKHMPSVTYLRLDGTDCPSPLIMPAPKLNACLSRSGDTPTAQRFGVTQQFNADPTIDVLLVTTAVGGLGLNLTGADTVMFVESDWNPQRDAQAMDRAHRIGQRAACVNVYRLITRNTIEERILASQRFKLSVANTVVAAVSCASPQLLPFVFLISLACLAECRKLTANGAWRGAGPPSVLICFSSPIRQTETTQRVCLLATCTAAQTHFSCCLPG